MSDLARVCAECGEVFESDSSSAYCNECKPTRTRDLRTKKERGYDKSWERLSIKARKKQPFCSDCGKQSDLQLDHSPEAWKAHERGQRITLDMVDVVCGHHNRLRGQAKGIDPNWSRPRDIRDIL